MEELKELYTVEYGESMDATIARGVTADGTASGLAEALRKSLALREKTLERRRVNDIFSSESIYSKPKDAISIVSGSSTEYEEPWSDPDIEIGEAFEDEFSTSKKQQRFEPSAPLLSEFSTTSLSREETKAIEMLDQAIEDSGYSSPNSLSSSSSPNIPSSPTNEVGFQGGYETDISNCSFYDTSSTEYDTEAEIRSYENVPLQLRTKKLRARKARNASSAGAEARYSYKDIEQGLASFQSDTDFSDEWSDASSLSSTDGYDTVYTSSISEYSDDDNAEWDGDSSDDRSDEDELPPPPSEEELAALRALVELDNPAEPAELNAYPKVSNPDEVESAKATDILEATGTDFRFTNQDVIQEVSNVADIKDITEDLQEESTSASVLEIIDQKDTGEDSLQQSMSANLRDTTSPNLQEQSTVRSQDELLKKASTIASSKAQARQASKIASSHIKHRIFAKDILAAAIAAGDENESDHSQILG